MNTNNRSLLVGMATVGFGVSTLLRKMSVSVFNPFEFEIIAAILHFSFIVPYYIFYRLGNKDVQIYSIFSYKALFVTLLCCVIGNISNIIFMFALRNSTDTGTIASLASASPIITIMLAALFLGEQPDLKQSIGIFFVLIGVIVASGNIK